MTTLKVRDLVGRSVPFYVRFPNAKVPEQYVADRLISASVTFPDARVTVESIRDYGNSTVYLTGTRLDGNKYGMYFNADFDGLAELTTAELAEVQSKFDEIQLAALQRNLGHSWYSGTDHTFFLEDENGNIIPGVSLYGETKAAENIPYARGMGVHMAVGSRSCLQEHHNLCASTFYGMLESAQRKPPKVRISMRTIADLPTGIVPANLTHKRATTKNVYGLIPQNKDDSFQVAESHYHFGVTCTEQKAAVIVKTLDATIGLACLSMFGKFEDSRRRLVSLPGDYAIKQSRIEYRALSNMWVCHPMVYYMVADVMRKAISLANNGYAAYWRATEHEVIDTLVSHDIERARKILERNRLVLNKMVLAAYPWLVRDSNNYDITNKTVIAERIDSIVNLFFQDVDNFIATPLDFGKNWSLNGQRGEWATNYGKMVYTHHPTIMAKKKVA